MGLIPAHYAWVRPDHARPPAAPKGQAKGRAKGRAKGQAKGRAKGQAKGRAKAQATDKQGRHTVASRYTFSATITAVTRPAAIIVGRRFTSVPIRSLLPVKTTSGMSANGMPKDRKTWLRTSALVGSKPTPISTSAGIMVIARRAKIGIWRWMKPCMTTWPDI